MAELGKLSFENLNNAVISCGLCARCGLCAGVCPLRVIGFDGNGFPKLKGNCKPCGICSACCPGGEVDFPGLSWRIFGEEYDPDNLNGHVEKMYVAHSNQNEVRKSGASGGVVTALLLHLLEKKKIDGAVVVGMNKIHPYKSLGLLATTREEILSAAKSKYCITPSMEVLRFLRKSSGHYVVVGLPCQIHGLRKLEEVDPVLSGKIICYLGLMCHYSLEPEATTDVISVRNIHESDIQHFAYRGGNWPGGFQVTKKSGNVIPLFIGGLRFNMNVLFRLYAPKRCYLCMDALAEYADLSFGDFWANDYSGPFHELKKSTLVLQRTGRGAAILSEAVLDGALTIKELPPERMSKRILNMAQEKKQIARKLIHKNMRKGKAVPDYCFEMEAPTISDKIYTLKDHFNYLLRQKYIRRLILRLFLSKAGDVINQMNTARKRWFHGSIKN
jgi:coenzyme F420 hydrogenase subunit beta